MPTKRSKYTLWLVFVAVNTSVGRICNETGLAVIAQAKPFATCMLHVFFFLVCFMPIFSALLWPLGRPHDAHDADDGGSWGTSGRLRGAVNPNKRLKIHFVGNVYGSMLFLMPFLGFLTPSAPNQAKMRSQLCS